MFFVYRGLQWRPTGAGSRPQAVFRANLYARKLRGRKKQEKSGLTQFFWGSNTLPIAPNPGTNRLSAPLLAKILTSVPRSAFFDGESRSRFGLELTEELEAAMSSSKALMSTVAALRAGLLCF